MAGIGKVIVTGCRGQLGTDLVSIFSGLGEVIGVDLPEFDVRNPEAVAKLLDHERPEAVIHAAAYTDVDGCESDEAQALAVNGEGTAKVARACAEVGAYLVYYSTDYVFDGGKASAYVESDTPDPRTVYGRTKLAGEQAVQEICADYAILRIAWVYGRHGRNFVKTMLQLGKQQLELGDNGRGTKPLKVVDDQFGNPTWTLDIVHQTELVLKKRLRGVFHATAEGETTWYRFARDVFDRMEMKVNLLSCNTAEYPRPAARPARSSLENARLKECGDNLMRDHREALSEFLEKYGKELLE